MCFTKSSWCSRVMGIFSSIVTPGDYFCHDCKHLQTFIMHMFPRLNPLSRDTQRCRYCKLKWSVQLKPNTKPHFILCFLLSEPSVVISNSDAPCPISLVVNLTQPRVLWEESLDWGIRQVWAMCVQDCLDLLIDVGGPSLLWAVLYPGPGLYRKAS